MSAFAFSGGRRRNGESFSPLVRASDLVERPKAASKNKQRARSKPPILEQDRQRAPRKRKGKADVPDDHAGERGYGAETTDQRQP